MTKVLCVAGVFAFVAALPSIAVAEAPSGAVVPPTPGTDADDDHRQGPFLVASLGIGAGLFAADLQLGWTFVPELSAFVSLGGFAVVEDDGGGVSTKGVGARAWHVPYYVEVRAEAATVSSSCDFDDPCTRSTEWLWAVGVGAELIHTRNFGLELRAEELLSGNDTAFVASLGIGFHY